MTFGSTNDSSSPLSADYIWKFVRTHTRKTVAHRIGARMCSNCVEYAFDGWCEVLVTRDSLLVEALMQSSGYGFSSGARKSHTTWFSLYLLRFVLVGGLVRHGGGGARGPTVNNIRIYKSNTWHSRYYIETSNYPSTTCQKLWAEPLASVYNNHRRWIDSLVNIRICDGAGVALRTAVIATYAVVYY